MRPSFFAALFFLLSGYVHAQPSKVEKTIDQIERTRNTFEKIRGIIPKKNKTDSAKPAGSSVQSEKVQPPKTGATLISISGIEFSKLKIFTDNIKACTAVQSAAMKYNSTISTIEVKHTCTTEELLKLMEETSKDIFTEKNIENFEEGKINLKLK